MAEVSKVAQEEHTEEHATSLGLDNRKLMMWVFLASETLFFGSLISTYMVFRGKSLVGPYPEDIFNIPYTSVSAFVLLMSSLTMVLALSALQRGDQRRTRIWIMTTALLGSVFLGGQVFEFTTFVHHGLTLSTNVFGSSFFVLTGFHGAHVTFGVVWLLSLFLYSFRGGVTAKRHLDIDLAALYWHFDDVLWILIFTHV